MLKKEDLPPKKLRFGPYNPPVVWVNDWLVDAIDGLVQVGGWSKSPINWPRKKRPGLHSLILCDELVRAIRSESAGAVAYWFGVSLGTVWTWRKALGVTDFNNPGSTEQRRESFSGRIPREQLLKNLARSKTPETFARIAATKRKKQQERQAAQAADNNVIPAPPKISVPLRRKNPYQTPTGMTPTEKRRIALDAIERGQSYPEVAHLVGVTARTVRQWISEYRQTGKDAPARRGNTVKVLSAGQLAQLKQLLQAQPNLTMAQIKEHLNLSWHISTVTKYMRRELGWRYKKNPPGE